MEGIHLQQQLSNKHRYGILRSFLGKIARTKSYTDQRRRPLEFAVDDHVFLKVQPRQGVVRLGKKEKLLPRYIGPFKILQRIGEVAFRLAFPLQLAGVHNVVHVSLLRKHISSASHTLKWEG